MENQNSLKMIEKSAINWNICQECMGFGNKKRRPKKKLKLRYQTALEQFEKSNKNGIAPTSPQGHIESCRNCSGSGLIPSTSTTLIDKENYPHVAIIGGGIGGVALAVACSHRGIPFTLYERDTNFLARSQGYGLTLQQASKAIEGLGILSLKEGITSTRHVVHNTDGKIIGEWGFRNRIQTSKQSTSKRRNVHIARQALRFALLEQLGEQNIVQWNHQLVDFKETEQDITLNFKVNGQKYSTKADLLVGADGIRSAVRNHLIGEETTPLRYLGCIVILGICLLKDLDAIESSLLDSATVFQTANGSDRIYIMPYDAESVMWQLSFQMTEKKAKELSNKGTKALKEEACRRTQWHNPIPQILAATPENKVSGYPVYDRELLESKLLEKGNKVTLIGDAAHPMSPFKGQGANQALLDALSLAREITKGCMPSSEWKKAGIRQRVLKSFELKMLKRSAIKVRDSAEAAKFLHSEIILHEGNETRGKCLNKKDS
uniref:FAD-dependent oxidoreductase n=1 Tax=Flavobacterium sp. TaxID=239 RepID=UPI00404ACF65